MDLQQNFQDLFPGEIFYAIKPGEEPPGDETVIENTFAAQLLYAFMLEAPYDAHLKSRIFANYHNRIFNRNVDVYLIYFLYKLYNIIEENIGAVEEPVVKTYKPTRFFILYLLKKAMKADPVGKTFFDSYKLFLEQHKDRYHEAFSKLTKIMIIELNRELADLKGANQHVEYKNLLRNSEDVNKLANSIISGYNRILVHHTEDKLETLLVTEIPERVST